MPKSAASKVMWVRSARMFALLLAGMVALMLGYATKAYAAPGYLDPFFDTDGKANTDFADHNDVGVALALQEDGKAVVAGSSTNDVTGQDFALTRYNVDGSLDTSFGTGGKVTTPISSGGAFDYPRAVAVRADGKIVVAGYAPNGSFFDFAIARYNADGTLDTSFSGDGKVITAVGTGSDFALSVALQGDKVVVAGVSYNGDPASGGTGNDFALVRYNNNGNLDATFGSGGVVKTDFSGSGDAGSSVVVQQDGKIVVAGHAYNGSTPGNDFALARYNTDGTLDTTFDTDGKAVVDFGSGPDQAFGVALQEDGKIVAAGRAYNSSANYDFAFACYRTNGSLDGEFGTNGKAVVDFGSDDVANALALQDDGRMVLAGGSGGDFALARLNDDGSPSASFHNDGKLKTDFFGASDVASGVAVQEDGKIVAAGYASNGSHNDFALARYYGGNDDTPPKVRPLVQSFITGSTLKSTGMPDNVPVRFSWSATDVHGEATGYDLQRSMDGSAYQNISLPSATTTTVTQLLSPTHNYRYRVRATDDNGNTSFWTYGPRFTAIAQQESSSAISYNGTWKGQSMTSAYGGALKHARASGATAELTFTGRNVAWVATKANNRGRAEVWLDGKKVATVDLYSSKAMARKVVFSANGLNPSVTHTLRVKVLRAKRSASSGVRVDVDAFVVLR